MKALDFWYATADPAAAPLFEQLPQALEGCSYRVRYRPLPGGGAEDALVRLALACGEVEGLPGRRVVEAILRAVADGTAADPQALARQLQPALDPQGEEVAQRLRAHAQEAAALGLAATAIACEGRLYRGAGALAPLRAALLPPPR